MQSTNAKWHLTYQPLLFCFISLEDRKIYPSKWSIPLWRSTKLIDYMKNDHKKSLKVLSWYFWENKTVEDNPVHSCNALTRKFEHVKLQHVKHHSIRYMGCLTFAKWNSTLFLRHVCSLRMNQMCQFNHGRYYLGCQRGAVWFYVAR